MRKTFTATLVLVAALTFAVPASAAPRDGDAPVFTRIVRLLKRAFGIGAQSTPTIPIPKQMPDGDGN